MTHTQITIKLSDEQKEIKAKRVLDICILEILRSGQKADANLGKELFEKLLEYFEEININ